MRDRPGFERICRSGEKFLFCHFLGLHFTGLKQNHTLNSEMRGTDRNHYAKRSKLLCKFVTFSRPTDRLFRPQPHTDLHWEFRRPVPWEPSDLVFLKIGTLCRGGKPTAQKIRIHTEAPCRLKKRHLEGEYGDKPYDLLKKGAGVLCVLW